jgi:4-methyl-5(b-hydroxyethyl)-thiazole monophosphate biosynthesis
MNPPKVMVVVADGFEEIETVTPVDVLRRAGAQVIIASQAEGIHVTGRSGVTIHADATLSSLLGADFDCIVLPGGPGVERLRRDPRVLDLISKQVGAGRWVAAICAAPVLLQAAGVLKGHRFTAHFSVAEETPGCLSGERALADGLLITSRGAGTALDFGLLIVEKLFSTAKALEIGASICT